MEHDKNNREISKNPAFGNVLETELDYFRWRINEQEFLGLFWLDNFALEQVDCIDIITNQTRQLSKIVQFLSHPALLEEKHQKYLDEFFEEREIPAHKNRLFTTELEKGKVVIRDGLHRTGSICKKLAFGKLVELPIIYLARKKEL
ncbi:MAG: hypothetical protein V1847_04580 [Candidatus Diapherotrites archaeon]